MIVERTFDLEEINGIFQHPKVVDHICDDFSKGLQLPVIDRFCYLAARQDGKTYGMVLLTPLNGCTLDSHIAFLPQFYGKMSREAGRMAIEWVVHNTTFAKINCSIPAFNKKVQNYVEDLGYKHEGVSTKAFMRKSKLYDLIYYGLELTRCHQQH